MIKKLFYNIRMTHDLESHKGWIHTFKYGWWVTRIMGPAKCV